MISKYERLLTLAGWRQESAEAVVTMLGSIDTMVDIDPSKDFRSLSADFFDSSDQVDLFNRRKKFLLQPMAPPCSANIQVLRPQQEVPASKWMKNMSQGKQDLARERKDG